MRNTSRQLSSLLTKIHEFASLFSFQMSLHLRQEPSGGTGEFHTLINTLSSNLAHLIEYIEITKPIYTKPREIERHRKPRAVRLAFDIAGLFDRFRIPVTAGTRSIYTKVLTAAFLAADDDKVDARELAQYIVDKYPQRTDADWRGE